jgi:hypothetical protein
MVIYSLGAILYECLTGRLTVFLMLVLGCWVALCGEWHALGSGGETFPGGAVGAAANPQGMLSLLGATGTLALTLLLTAAGTFRRRPFALGAGLVLRGGLNAMNLAPPGSTPTSPPAKREPHTQKDNRRP